MENTATVIQNRISIEHKLDSSHMPVIRLFLQIAAKALIIRSQRPSCLEYNARYVEVAA